MKVVRKSEGANSVMEGEAAPDPPLLGAAVRRRLSGGGEEKTKEGEEGVLVEGAAVAVGSLGGSEHTRTEGDRE